MYENPNPHYRDNSELVARTIRTLQSHPGQHYSDPESRRVRETIAVNVHLGLPPTEGL